MANAIFSTIVNKTTTYRAKRIYDEPLGNWLYRWNIESTLNSNDKNDVIATCSQSFNSWVTASFIDVEFNRATASNEYFRITIETQQTDCTSIYVIDVLVTEHFSQLTCTNPISLVDAPSCIFTDSEIYTYKYCCTDTIDEVYFQILGGSAYDNISGAIYSPPTNIKIITDDNNCAYIKVKWSELYAKQPDFNNYRISAFSKSGDRISIASSLIQYPIPNNISGYIVDPPSTLAYNSLSNTIRLMLYNLPRYASDYRLEVYFRYAYHESDNIRPEETEWSAWYDVVPAEYQPKLLISELLPLYEKEFFHTFDIGDYTAGNEYLWYEFKTRIYHCEDEGTCEYHFPDICEKEQLFTKVVPLTHCITQIDYHQYFNIEANGCPTIIEPGILTVTNTCCQESIYSLNEFSYTIVI